MNLRRMIMIAYEAGKIKEILQKNPPRESHICDSRGTLVYGENGEEAD